MNNVPCITNQLHDRFDPVSHRVGSLIDDAGRQVKRSNSRRAASKNTPCPPITRCVDSGYGQC
jgi:hypothetical protein